MSSGRDGIRAQAVLCRLRSLLPCGFAQRPGSVNLTPLDKRQPEPRPLLTLPSSNPDLLTDGLLYQVA